MEIGSVGGNDKGQFCKKICKIPFFISAIPRYERVVEEGRYSSTPSIPTIKTFIYKGFLVRNSCETLKLI